MKILLIIVGLLIGALAFLILSAKSKLNNLASVEDNERVVALNDQNFQQQTTGRVVLVDFWASWCAPCRMMAPVLNEVATDLSTMAPSGTTQVGKVDVEAHPALAQKYQVRSIPTLILFKNGVEIERFVGVKSKSFLLQQIQKAEGSR